MAGGGEYPINVLLRVNFDVSFCDVCLISPIYAEFGVYCWNFVDNTGGDA